MLHVGTAHIIWKALADPFSSLGRLNGHIRRLDLILYFLTAAFHLGACCENLNPEGQSDVHNSFQTPGIVQSYLKMRTYPNLVNMQMMNISGITQNTTFAHF